MYICHFNRKKKKSVKRFGTEREKSVGKRKRCGSKNGRERERKRGKERGTSKNENETD